jgi:hypothetical protein
LKRNSTKRDVGANKGVATLSIMTLSIRNTLHHRTDWDTKNNGTQHKKLLRSVAFFYCYAECRLDEALRGRYQKAQCQSAF